MDISSVIYSFKEIASVIILVLSTLLVSMVMFVSAKHLRGFVHVGSYVCNSLIHMHLWPQIKSNAFLC